MTYSADARREMSKVNADNLPLTLLEIYHPNLVTPIHVVNDRQDIEFNGDNYIALGFNIALPSDLQKGLPRARLAIDNIGKELIQWLEESNGGANTTVRIMQILRSDPSTVEFDITMTLTNILVTSTVVSGELGFEDLLNIPAVTIMYTPEFAAGLF